MLVLKTNGEGEHVLTTQKVSKVLFFVGIVLILASPYLARCVMETIFVHQINFIDYLFLGIEKTLYLSGFLLSLAGIVGYTVNALKKKL